MRFRRSAFACSTILYLMVSVTASINAADDTKRTTPTGQSGETDDSASEEPSPDVQQATASEEAQWTLRDVAYLLAPILSLVGVGLIVYFTRKNVISEQWLKINASEAQYIQDKLDKFYGPFILESQANHLMAQDLRSRQPEPTMYRLLDKLFDEDWRSNLPAGDTALVEEICNTGERLRAVIRDSSGLVDPLLLPYIARAITHFRILKLAHENKLGDDSSPFLRYVYPKTLDSVLKMELDRLQIRLKLLRQNPTVCHSDLSPLDLSNHPLDPWPDPARPDPENGKLTPPTREGGSLL